MGNLEIYNKIRVVPEEAKKKITGGRIGGMTDINPMWRIKTLTDNFGICGIGWKYAITSQKLEKGCNDEVSAFVTIDLFIKVDNEWSEGIPGVGGSSFVAKEKNGMYQSDECFKMALTDAISVSCKALGMGADVYFEKDRTKYDAKSELTPPAVTTKPTIDTPAIVTIEDYKEKMKKCTTAAAIKQCYGLMPANIQTALKNYAIELNNELIANQKINNNE